MNFADFLDRTMSETESLVCVGLDINIDRLPSGVGLVEFNREIIQATAPYVSSYKPNVAFYDAIPDGHAVLKETVQAIHDAGRPAIGDSKRGDVPDTSVFHAKAMFDEYGFDAATVNAYGGRDTVIPFLDHKDKGVFIWCKSSNRGAGDFQDLQVFGSDGEIR